MKQTTAPAKRYVPYGINGEYFVYDNQEGNIPIGYGTGGTKKKIQAICDTMNSEETSISKDSLEGKKYWAFGGMVDGYGIRCNDGRTLINQEHGNGLQNLKVKDEIVTALNNYNALKEANKELVEALDEITEMAKRWSNKGLTPTIFKAEKILQKAKQL